MKPETAVALRSAAVYAAVSIAWILFSDNLVFREEFQDPRLVKVIQMSKGVVFVLATAAVLYVLLVRGLRRTGEVQSALRQREELFHALFEHSMDALFVLDDAGRVVDANAAAVTMAGAPRNSVVGVRLSDFMRAEQHGDAGLPLEAASDTGQLRGESVVVRPDGGRVAVTFRIRHGVLPGRHLALVRDVAAQRSLEEQLRHSQRMEALGRLAGGVAHDFNNILTAILGHTEMLAEDQPEGSPLRADLEEIRGAALRASALTGQLLAFSRRQVLQPRVLDLATALRSVEPMLRRIIGEDVELEIAAPAGITVRADPNQIEQVVVNLAVNARDAMPGGGRLTLGVATRTLEEREEMLPGESVEPGTYAVLSVSDTGMGITPEVVDRIFEPFFTTKERGRGSGLGLSTVYGIVSQSGGGIRLETTPGKGCTFHVHLPLVSEPPERLDERPGPRLEHGAETVLLVEDEDAVRHLACRALESRGYTVLPAADGASALALARGYEGPIDLVVSDVVMPGLSGPHLADALRDIRPGIRVIFISGYAEDALGSRAPADQDAGFLAKPFTGGELGAAVRAALDDGRAGR
jgi:two-component system cell cycle sensor histidine kinase/response regulator CckA